MKQDWHPDELAQHWTLAPDEHKLLGNKTGATRLSFAILLKAFQFDGRFPDRREDVAGSVVVHLASRTDVAPEAYSDGEWSERTQRQQRAQIREHCGFRVFRVEDEPALIAWFSERVTSPNPEAEAFRSRRTATCARSVWSRRQPSGSTACCAWPWRNARTGWWWRPPRDSRRLPARLWTHSCRPKRQRTSVDTDQMQLFPVRSEELAAVKEGAGAVKVETVLDEIAKLKQLRALGLPESYSATCLPSSLRITASAPRANRPRELGVIRPRCATRCAALCWQREQEITDNLVELLIHIAHRVGVRAEGEVDLELMKYARKVLGKARLLYQLAKAAKGQPYGVVREVIYPAVGEKTLRR